MCQKSQGADEQQQHSVIEQAANEESSMRHVRPQESHRYDTPQRTLGRLLDGQQLDMEGLEHGNVSESASAGSTSSPNSHYSPLNLQEVNEALREIADDPLWNPTSSEGAPTSTGPISTEPISTEPTSATSASIEPDLPPNSDHTTFLSMHGSSDRSGSGASDLSHLHLAQVPSSSSSTDAVSLLRDIHVASAVPEGAPQDRPERLMYGLHMDGAVERCWHEDGGVGGSPGVLYVSEEDLKAPAVLQRLRSASPFPVALVQVVLQSGSARNTPRVVSIENPHLRTCETRSPMASPRNSTSASLSEQEDETRAELVRRVSVATSPGNGRASSSASSYFTCQTDCSDAASEDAERHVLLDCPPVASNAANDRHGLVEEQERLSGAWER